MAYGQTLKVEDLNPDRLPQLTLPYLGRAKLVGVEAETITKKVTDESWDVLQFTFELLDGDAKGLTFQQAFFPVRDDAERAEEKKANQVNVIGYILKYFCGPESAVAAMNAAETFEQVIANAVLAASNKADKWKDKIVTIKVLGSVYKGKTQLSFPGYIGFISDGESDAPVTLSKKEMANNFEYVAFLSQPTTSSDDLKGGPPVTQTNNLF